MKKKFYAITTTDLDRVLDELDLCHDPDSREPRRRGAPFRAGPESVGRLLDKLERESDRQRERMENITSEEGRHFQEGFACGVGAATWQVIQWAYAERARAKKRAR